MTTEPHHAVVPDPAPRPHAVPPDLTIVVPCFDEAHRLGPTLDRIRAWIGGRDEAVDVLVVDDGSTDATAAVARRALAGADHRVLTHPRNRGKGAALRTGMTAATGALVLFTDADLSTPIEAAGRFLAAHRAGHAVVIGSRKTAGARVTRRQHPVRETMGKVYSSLSRGLICPGVTDFTCGFKGFRAPAAVAVFSRAAIDGWAFDVEAVVAARNRSSSSARPWSVPTDGSLGEEASSITLVGCLS